MNSRNIHIYKKHVKDKKKKKSERETPIKKEKKDPRIAEALGSKYNKIITSFN